MDARQLSLTFGEVGMIRRIAEDQFLDGNVETVVDFGVWAWSPCGDRASAALHGSLVKKGLAWSAGTGREKTVGLTKAGLAIYQSYFPTKSTDNSSTDAGDRERRNTMAKRENQTAKREVIKETDEGIVTTVVTEDNVVKKTVEASKPSKKVHSNSEAIDAVKRAATAAAQKITDEAATKQESPMAARQREIDEAVKKSSGKIITLAEAGGSKKKTSSEKVDTMIDELEASAKKKKSEPLSPEDQLRRRVQSLVMHMTPWIQTTAHLNAEVASIMLDALTRVKAIALPKVTNAPKGCPMTGEPHSWDSQGQCTDCGLWKVGTPAAVRGPKPKKVSKAAVAKVASAPAKPKTTDAAASLKFPKPTKATSKTVKGQKVATK